MTLQLAKDVRVFCQEEQCARIDRSAGIAVGHSYQYRLRFHGRVMKEGKDGTNLPAIMISLPSSVKDASVGDALTSFSITALISQLAMSCGYFSGSHIVF